MFIYIRVYTHKLSYYFAEETDAASSSDSINPKRRRTDTGVEDVPQEIEEARDEIEEVGSEDEDEERLLSEEARQANQRKRQEERRAALEAAFPGRLLHQQCYEDIFKRNEAPAPASSQPVASPLPSPLVRALQGSLPSPWPLPVETADEDGPPPLE